MQSRRKIGSKPDNFMEQRPIYCLRINRLLLNRIVVIVVIVAIVAIVVI